MQLLTQLWQISLFLLPSTSGESWLSLRYSLPPPRWFQAVLKKCQSWVFQYFSLSIIAAITIFLLLLSLAKPIMALKCCAGTRCIDMSTDECLSYGNKTCGTDPDCIEPTEPGGDQVSEVFGTVRPPPGAARYGGFKEGLIPFLNNLLRLVFIIAGLYAFLNLLIAGFQFMAAGGDPKKIQTAWQKIWQSFMGLIILVSSFLIAAVIGIVLFGDPTAILKPKIVGAP